MNAAEIIPAQSSAPEPRVAEPAAAAPQRADRERGEVDFFGMILAVISSGVNEVRLPVEDRAAGEIDGSQPAGGGGSRGTGTSIVAGTFLEAQIVPATMSEIQALLSGGVDAFLESWADTPFRQSIVAMPDPADAALLPIAEAELPMPGEAGPGAPIAQEGASGRVLVQIIRAISTQAERGVEQMRLRLYPPTLGRVDVTLSMQDGKLSASIRVETEQARHIIESGLGGLKESLAAGGLDVAGFDVSSSDRRYETMPIGGRRFHRSAFSLEVIGEEPVDGLSTRIAWPWSAIDTVA